MRRVGQRPGSCHRTCLISGGDGPEVFEFVEEALDGVALAVNPGAEREGFDTSLGQAETDRTALGIDRRMDLGVNSLRFD